MLNVKCYRETLTFYRVSYPTGLSNLPRNQPKTECFHVTTIDCRINNQRVSGIYTHKKRLNCRSDVVTNLVKIRFLLFLKIFIHLSRGNVYATEYKQTYLNEHKTFVEQRGRFFRLRLWHLHTICIQKYALQLEKPKRNLFKMLTNLAKQLCEGSRIKDTQPALYNSFAV